MGVENLLHGFDVTGRAHERVGDEIDVVLHGPFDEAAVLLRHRRQGDRHSGNVDALARTHGASHDKLAVELLVRLAHDANFQFAVGDQHPRPDRNVVHDRGDIHINHLAGGEIRAVRTAHRHPVARAEIDAVPVFVGDRRHADLGSLGIDHDRNGRIDPVYDLDDTRGALLRDVGRIDTDHVHSGIEKFRNELFRATEIRHGGDDLGFFHAIHMEMLFNF